MKKQPLGCLSITGIVAGLITLAGLCVSYIGWGGALFSPGALNAQTGEVSLGGVSSHADTNGQCSLCHSPPLSQESMAMRCLDCHESISEKMSIDQDLHGFVAAETGLIFCRDCHTEHIGDQSLITFQGTRDYPHDLFEYSLRGHHDMLDGSDFTCADCHTKDITQFSLETCESCHREFEDAYIQTHIEDFGTACLECHDGIDTYDNSFNHESISFDMSGGHAPLACLECHEIARTLAELKSLPGECIDCHRDDDVHAGELGQSCGTCHSPDDWTQFVMNHSLTDYPLLGKHADVDCASCHVADSFSGTPASCIDCHQQDDIHNGVFGTTCTDCHTEAGWELVSFDHTQSQATNCSACHLVDRPSGHFPGQCSACHTTDTWAGAIFIHTFPINHKGAKGVCSKCHPSNANPPYSVWTCANCHKKSKIDKKHKKEGISNYQNCIRCHWNGKEND